ncbi:MAG: ComEC/Rec2 family competence protein [Lachnospiraceae bacterium]|nr:ComEC/Rec2 family competence protein [Lachnospiraceae bacterium]
MPVRRPVCLICLFFLLIIYIATSGKAPVPSWDVDAASGITVRVTGKVFDRQEKNGTFQVFLKDVSFDSDKAYFPSHSKGILIKLNDGADHTDLIRLGSRIEVTGVFSPFDISRCEGMFDARSYYMIRGYEGQLKRARLLGVSKGYNRLTESLRRLRERSFAILSENMSENDAALVAAMTLGDKSQLDTQIKELYQSAGISHVLALSGLHIASVGLALLRILKKLGIDVRFSSVIAGGVITMYAVMTGLSTSTIRALFMFLLSVTAILAGRSYDLISAAAVSAVLILFENPYYIYDTGFLLSFGAVMGIVLIYPLFSYIPDHIIPLFPLPDKAGRLVLNICRSVCVTLSVMIMTLPVTGYSFMQVSLLSTVINLAVIPLMGLVLFTGFLGITAGLLGIKPYVILLITHYILSFYELLGETSAKIRKNILLIGKPEKYQIITYVLIIAIAVFIGNLALSGKLNNIGGRKSVDRTGRYFAFYNACDYKRNGNKITYNIEFSHDSRRKKLTEILSIVIFLLLTASACLILMLRPKDEVEIRNIDVGQGDCAVIFGAGIPVCMIDGGSTDVKQVGKYRILPVLKANRISEVEYCFLTHMDSDHVSGIIEILQDDTCVTRIKNEASGIKVGTMPDL